MRRANLIDHPLPERQRLGVRIVYTEDAHALFDPKEDDVAQRKPESRHRSAGVEINVDNVLVFLRRVLGETDSAIGPPIEPFRVLLEPRMIWRALNSEIKRDLNSVR